MSKGARPQQVSLEEQGEEVEAGRQGPGRLDPGHRRAEEPPDAGPQASGSPAQAHCAHRTPRETGSRAAPRPHEQSTRVLNCLGSWGRSGLSPRSLLTGRGQAGAGGEAGRGRPRRPPGGQSPAHGLGLGHLPCGAHTGTRGTGDGSTVTSTHALGGRSRSISYVLRQERQEEDMSSLGSDPHGSRSSTNALRVASRAATGPG